MRENKGLGCLLLLTLFTSGCFINGNGQAQGEAKDNGNGNGNGNLSNNGSGNGSGNSIDVNDGIWDITSGGAAAIGASQMIVVEAHATGFIARVTEGRAESNNPSCTREKDRTEFVIDAKGDVLDGTFTLVREWNGTWCPPAIRRQSKVTGKRTKAGANDLDGEWNLTYVAGSESFGGFLQVSKTDGTINATSSRPELSFAARKR
jgi:hypothetical protein